MVLLLKPDISCEYKKILNNKNYIKEMFFDILINDCCI